MRMRLLKVAALLLVSFTLLLAACETGNRPTPTPTVNSATIPYSQALAGKWKVNIGETALRSVDPKDDPPCDRLIEMLEFRPDGTFTGSGQLFGSGASSGSYRIDQDTLTRLTLKTQDVEPQLTLFEVPTETLALSSVGRGCIFLFNKLP